ncbi:MAG: hypothetical protein WCJ64_25715 [Rhodospirillaceae bacterium]
MDPTILVFAWFWLGQQPATSQIPFSSMALCQDARRNLIDDRKRALEETNDSRRVPQLTAVCLPTGPGKPAATQTATASGGMDWLISQPLNLLDWGLQRAANSIEAIRSIKVVYDMNGTAKDDVLDVDFSLVETSRFKYTIQGTVTTKAAELANESYCMAALKAWRQAVLKANGDKPSASIDVWFVHADRNPAERPKALADTIAANFDFKMTINGPDPQSVVSCLTSFAADPVLPAPSAKTLLPQK